MSCNICFFILFSLLFTEEIKEGISVMLAENNQDNVGFYDQCFLMLLLNYIYNIKFVKFWKFIFYNLENFSFLINDFKISPDVAVKLHILYRIW